MLLKRARERIWEGQAVGRIGEKLESRGRLFPNTLYECINTKYNIFKDNTSNTSISILVSVFKKLFNSEVNSG